MPEQAETEVWEDVEPGDLRPGDYVRAMDYHSGARVHREGEFAELFTSMGYDYVRIGGEGCDVRRPFKRRVTAGTWVPVTDFTTLAHGDRVRSTQTLTAEHVVEGEFDKLTANGRVMLVGRSGQYFADPSVRRWEKLTTTQAPAEPSWVPIEHGQIREGMYVRCTTLPDQVANWGADPYEGHVTRVYESGRHPFFTLNGEGRRADIRTWERRVTPEVVAEAMAPTPFDAASEYSWVPILSAEIREGMWVRGTHSTRTTDGRGDSPVVAEGEVESVRSNFGRISVKLAGAEHARWCYQSGLRTWERRVPANVAALDEVVSQASARPGGWEVVTDLSTLRRGDTVRSTPDQIGGVMQAVVESTYRDTFTARTTHVIEPSSNGRDTDLNGWRGGFGSQTYSYGAERGHNTIKWLGSGPAPDPAAREARAATPATQAPIPDWATSLEEARRHVHTVARSLWSGMGGDNCSGGTSDFMEAAGLPDHRDEYPAPSVVDETEQIKAFLTQVREAALNTAMRHGKDMDQVRLWLRREGIVEPTPPPVEYMVMVTAPAGTTREDVINSARQLGRQGWEIR
jgi:hypothetical protein